MTTKHQPATPLPQLAVQWDETKERVSLITLGNRPHDYVLAASKDSGKGKVYEQVAHAANAYPKLVEALRAVPLLPFHGTSNGERWDEGYKAGFNRALNDVNESVQRLLRELGEAS